MTAKPHAPILSMRNQLSAFAAAVLAGSLCRAAGHRRDPDRYQTPALAGRDRCSRRFWTPMPRTGWTRCLSNPGQGGAHHQPNQRLARITDPVVIDGTTQPGYAARRLSKSTAPAPGHQRRLAPCRRATARFAAWPSTRFYGAGIHVQAPGEPMSFRAISSAPTPRAP